MKINKMNSGLCIKDICLNNRIVVPPMASQTADKNGFATFKTIEHYSRLSKAQSSIVMVEYTFVDLSGRSEPNQLGIQSDQHIEGLKKLNSEIKSTGAYSALQLVHAGGKSERSLTDGTLLSPSGIKVPTKNEELELPDTANMKDIKNLRDSFVLAAKRADTAGFDIIELHAAHGYGLNQWISPVTNHRIDVYGGSNENRFRILLEIISEIKEKTPRLKISVRIPGMDHFPGGLTHNDTIELAQLLENKGIDIVNVSSGIGGWRRPRDRNGEGYLVEDAEIIQKHINIPVIGVGGVKTPEYIHSKISDNSVSLLAVGRSILENENWGPNIGLKR